MANFRPLLDARAAQRALLAWHWPVAAGLTVLGALLLVLAVVRATEEPRSSQQTTGVGPSSDPEAAPLLKRGPPPDASSEQIQPLDEP